MGAGPSCSRDPEPEGSASSDYLEEEDDREDEAVLLSPAGSLGGLRQAARSEGFTITGE